LKFTTVALKGCGTFIDGSGRDVEGVVIIGFDKFTIYGRAVKCVAIELQQTNSLLGWGQRVKDVGFDLIIGSVIILQNLGANGPMRQVREDVHSDFDSIPGFKPLRKGLVKFSHVIA
jgi:hypothetical protein